MSLLDKFAGSQDWPVFSCGCSTALGTAIKSGLWTFHFSLQKQGRLTLRWCLQSCGAVGQKQTSAVACLRGQSEEIKGQI